MHKIPKYLVECEWEADMESLPERPLWVARLRGPFVLGLADIGETTSRIALWPAILGDGKPRASLVHDLVRQIFRDRDEWEGAHTPPVAQGIAPEPPQFIHMIVPAGTAEYIIDPHSPRLWRVGLDSDGNETGLTWWQGFGLPPQNPLQEMREVLAFLRKK